ncbi:hypothetical protein H8A97_28365 [Bradyrhizobium sp. Arg62]|uniref:hypothetical protein n=1 Tax=Bradyrhizobium TaxID=374 RepID=UPI001E570BD0|nr:MULTISPECIES: hypothetical protein [Bradyrhizobium]MCC8941913.1 hypothetical protein [Bradyrhizobium ivorense]MCC8948913.1 hypothetical protein [Bradyrhizobium brasilense]
MDDIRNPFATAIAALVSRRLAGHGSCSAAANFTDATHAMLVLAYGPSQELLFAGLIVLKQNHDDI